MSHAISIYEFPDAAPEVRELQKVMKAIACAKSKAAAAREFADPGREGWSWQNLESLWRKWEKAGRNPLVLIDRRKHVELQAGKSEIGLPREFLAWAGGKMLENKRKSRPAHRAIIRQWQEWRKTGNPALRIPGYDTPPPMGSRRVPDGWSYTNLMRYAQPPVEERAIARIGTVAAKPYLPWIVGTREGVRFLEWVYFDDVVRDRNIVTPGQIEPMRILQLGSLCFGCGVYLKFGMRPDITRADGTRDRLKRRDFLFLVASLLMEYGYPADYVMHLVVERGTATMNQAEAQYLYDISDGQIQVGYTSMEGQFVLAWQEAATGNPMGKSPLESWHNLLHNEEASLPGHVGKDRNHAPAALHGSNREVVALNKAALLLTREQRQELRLPYATFNQAHLETLEIVGRINRRTDHEMEGFEHVMDWRVRGLQMDWQPEALLTNLDPALREQVEFLPRIESPIERLQRLSAGVRLIKPHPGALVRFYEDSHTGTKIQALQAQAKIENKTFTFGPDSPLDALPNGTEVQLHHAPIDPAYALVTSGGKFVGVWKRQIVRRHDAAGLAEGIRRKQSFLHHAMSSVRGKMLDTLVEQDRRLSNNIEVLEEAGVLPSEADYSLATPVQPSCTGTAADISRAAEIIRSDEANEARAARNQQRAADFGRAVSRDHQQPETSAPEEIEKW